MQYDVVIVGAGMAGLTAGIYVARAGKSALILESNAIGGQIINALIVENWPGDKKVSGKDLMERVFRQAVDLGVEVKYEKTLSVIKNETKFVVRTDENKYECSTVIIATGTVPRKLNDEKMKEVGERPISYCATCDGALYKNRPVVVIGSGNTAKHETNYLNGICSKVYRIHHDEPIPEEAEAVFVAIGREPDTSFLNGLVKLDKDGYVLAEEDCVTSQAGVFVAGDCRTKDVRQLVTAAADGAVAAEAALNYLGN
ncbi:FAD-dependent oxidoreductase [Candidatus Saccharibacteria bacterium]|nr:FAD-dependent oxidoreductase [Candidatus Saccharibacteria bacterium]